MPLPAADIFTDQLDNRAAYSKCWCIGAVPTGQSAQGAPGCRLDRYGLVHRLLQLAVVLQIAMPSHASHKIFCSQLLHDSMRAHEETVMDLPATAKAHAGVVNCCTCFLFSRLLQFSVCQVNTDFGRACLSGGVFGGCHCFPGPQGHCSCQQGRGQD